MHNGLQQIKRGLKIKRNILERKVMKKSHKRSNKEPLGELEKSRTNSVSETGSIVDFYCVLTA